MLVNRTTLSRALSNAARIASSRGSLPVLAIVMPMQLEGK